MNASIRTALGRAIIESTAAGNDGFFAGVFVQRLTTDVTMPHDVAAFEITLADGITTIEVVATVTVKAPVQS